jgi:CheY-like chemotaxis protein
MPTSNRLEGTRVLIIEDEALAALQAEALLRELGCVPVGRAANVNAALEKINGSDDIDCATLDVRLDNEIASDVAGALIAKEIPFIVCSAYDIWLRDFKQIPIVGKPYTKEQFRAGLERALGVAR